MHGKIFNIFIPIILIATTILSGCIITANFAMQNKTDHPIEICIEYGSECDKFIQLDPGIKLVFDKESAPLITKVLIRRYKQEIHALSRQDIDQKIREHEEQKFYTFAITQSEVEIE